LAAALFVLPGWLVCSPPIEDRILDEIEDATFLLANLNTGNLLDSPYLVSAVYYSDGLFRKSDLDPTSRVIAGILPHLTADRREEYLELLRARFGPEVRDLPDEYVTPVPLPQTSKPRRRRRRATHQNALDIFIAEGTPVHSVTRGVVVLADGDWEPGVPMSSTSDRGGNAVIVFDTENNRFYRYCHLEAVTVETGFLVSPGQVVGQVGHTGRSAARKGHGRHLHFEINEYRDGTMRALKADELKELLRGYSTTAYARTGKVPKAFTLTGTAWKRKPVSGSAPRLHRCSQTVMPAPSSAECAGRPRSAVSSILWESMPTRQAPAATSALAAAAVRNGCSSKYFSVRQSRSQPV
jgi:murein DD-endopeptidase MepM/ murein hydrolase activator NlpD